MLIVAPSVKSQHQEDSGMYSNCAAGLIISPRIIIHIPNLVLVGVYLLKPTKRRTIKVCPRTVRMYANAQISGVFPDIVRTGSEVHFCRCPDTGLALASVPIRYVAEKWRRYSTGGYCDSNWLESANCHRDLPFRKESYRRWWNVQLFKCHSQAFFPLR